MYSPENNIGIKEDPSLSTTLDSSNNLVELEKKFLVEGIPKVEAFTERNPKAIQAFLEKYLKIETV